VLVVVVVAVDVVDVLVLVVVVVAVDVVDVLVLVVVVVAVDVVDVLVLVVVVVAVDVVDVLVLVVVVVAVDVVDVLVLVVVVVAVDVVDVLVLVLVVVLGVVVGSLVVDVVATSSQLALFASSHVPVHSIPTPIAFPALHDSPSKVKFPQAFALHMVRSVTPIEHVPIGMASFAKTAATPLFAQFVRKPPANPSVWQI
jgi:hypothetical protein